jgi:hypothetical protein
LAYIVLGDGRTVTAKINRDNLPRPGQAIGIAFDDARAHLFNMQGERIGARGDERRNMASA